MDTQFVREATLTLLEEVVEGSLEFFEHTSILDEVSLHFRSNLLIELEFFNNKVEIIQKSLLDIFSDVVVKSRLNMERLVRFFNFLNPHV